jgi:hydroxymethylpyrimidine kinase/phosphomethylpyrimidine kinase
MLCSKENILTVERVLAKNNVAQYILDPIIISSSGFPLIVPEGISLMKERLFPLATLVTPNLKEAEALSGLSISNEEDLRTAAEKICSWGPKAVLMKGLVVGRERIVDLLYSDKGAFRFEYAWLEDRNIHGAGCILSVAIAASLASGKEVRDAVEIARSYVLERIRSPLRPGKGEGFLYLT